MANSISQDVIFEAYQEKQYHLKDEWYREGYGLFLDVEGIADLLESLDIIANLPLSNARLRDFADKTRSDILADLNIAEEAR